MRQRTDYIIIDCSHTPASVDMDAKEIDRQSRIKGWLKIGVHYVIKRDGTRERGRPLSDVGAHSVGYNHKSVGILLIGGRSEDGKVAENNYTDAQMQTLEITLRELRQQYPAAKIIGQNQVQARQQGPSFDVVEYVSVLQSTGRL